MKPSEEILRMWKQCFPDVTPQWISAIGENAFADDRLLTASDASGKIISSLLLGERMLSFYGATFPIDYLSFACTLPRYRGMGSMRTLLSTALEDAHSRGSVAIILKPASDWLREYYERAGQWATVFYTRPLCYTSAHKFNSKGFTPIKSPDDCSNIADDIYRLMDVKGNSFAFNASVPSLNAVVADARLSGGNIYAVEADETGQIEGVAIAVPDNWSRVIHVKHIMVSSAEAYQSVLSYVKTANPQYGIMVDTPLSSVEAKYNDYELFPYARTLTPEAMIRIVDVEQILNVIAKSQKKGWKKVVRVSDPLIFDNNHTFLLQGRIGAAIIDPDTTNSSLGSNPYDFFNVGISSLARIIFGSNTSANILDFPAVRPTMSIELD